MFLIVVAGFAALLMGIAAAVGVAIGVLLGVLVVAVAVVHALSAWVVWRLRPKTRVLFRRQTWAVLCIPFGPMLAVVFWLLHWLKRDATCCNACGFVRARADTWTRCPECNEQFPTDCTQADMTSARA
jgi:hypothetical protein